MQRILLIITLGVFLGCSTDEIPDPFSVSNLEFEDFAQADYKLSQSRIIQ